MAKKSKPKMAKAKAKPAKKVAAKAAAKKPAKKSAAAKPNKSKASGKPATKNNVVPLRKPTKTVDLSMVFTPLDDRIVVRRDLDETKTAGGIFIPDTATTRPTTGQVVAVGRGHFDKKAKLRPLEVQVGEKVMFSTYSGTNVFIGADEFLILRETDVLGIVTK